MLQNLLKTQVVRLDVVRHIGQHNKKHIYKDGQKFANNFYYPRYMRLRAFYINIHKPHSK